MAIKHYKADTIVVRFGDHTFDAPGLPFTPLPESPEHSLRGTPAPVHRNARCVLQLEGPLPVLEYTLREDVERKRQEHLEEKLRMAQVAAGCPQVDLSRFNMSRMTCVVEPSFAGHLVTIQAWVEARDGSGPIQLTFQERFPWPLDSSPDRRHINGTIRRAVVNFVTHEVDECLTINGERKDPHRNEHF